MKTMKGLIVFLLFVGFSGSLHSGGRQGNGWNVTIVTGTATNISSGGQRVYLKAIYLSTGTTANTGGEYLQAFSTAPSTVNGGGIVLMPNHLFASTAAVTPSLIFQSTTSLAGSGNGVSLNNYWTAGDCDRCYIEIPGGSNGLHIRKSVENSGNAAQAAVLWSN